MVSTPDHPHDVASPPTVLTAPRAGRWMTLIGLPVVGVVLALLLPVLARWLLGRFNGLPLKPAFWFLGGIDDWWKVLVSAALGALAGMGAAARAVKRTVTIEVHDTDVLAEAGGWRQAIARTDIDAVFLDGTNLVVAHADSRRLVSVPVQAPSEAVAQAFRERGYPWLAADPFAGEYRLWLSGSAELPTEVNAVLAAREVALRKRSIAEVHDLATAVQHLGYAVREEGNRQYWRPLSG